jgi:hypothetical protein
MIELGCRHEIRIESVRPAGGDNAGKSARGFLSAHWYAGLQGYAPGAQKIRRLSSGGGNFRGDLRSGDLSPAHRPLGQDTLPSPVAGCRIRFPESLLMLNSHISQPMRFVKFAEQACARGIKSRESHKKVRKSRATKRNEAYP